MSLQDIVQVTITTQAKGISQAGFGTPLIAGYHDEYVDRVREYSDLASLASDGFSTSHPIYKAATAIFSQNPHPPTFKVGRRALGNTQTIELEVTDATEGLVYSLVVVSPDGTNTTVTYTVAALDTTNDIAVALAALLNAITDLTAPAPGAAIITCTADNTGELFFYNEINAELELTDITADPGIATDLAAIVLADPDWYALCIDSNSEAEIKAAAAYMETLEKIAAYNTADAGVPDSGVSDDVASDMEAAAYARAALIFSRDHDGYAGAAWLGKMLPTTPGSATWAFKTLAGVTRDVLTTTQYSTIIDKSCNLYYEVAGVNITWDGKTPSGEYLDIIRGRDWLKARLEERVFALLVNNPKVPYTDLGVDAVRSEVRAQLREGQGTGFIALTPEFTVTAPAVADVSDNDKANRILPDVFFEATLAGAIHVVQISGVLSL